MAYTDKLVNYYDKILLNSSQQEYYDFSGYGNFGFWDDSTVTVKNACDNLVDKLMSFIPNKRNNILDVACGAGGTTNRLMRYYNASEITAINISEKQLSLAKKLAPKCNYFLMDASNLQFNDATFDNIICIEAAFHFDTREQFLREAYRVLKPGGYLVMADIICPALFIKMFHSALHHPLENLTDEEGYKNLFMKCGFNNVVMIDSTNDSWKKFRSKMLISTWRFRYNPFKFFPNAMGTVMISFFMSSAIKKYFLFAAYKA